MSDTKTTHGILSDMELVHRQLHCVRHLCKAVLEITEAKLMILPKMATDSGLGHHMIENDGAWTNWFMQQVGDMLNNMDAVDPEEDKKWDKTFQEAAARWDNLAAKRNEELKFK